MTEGEDVMSEMVNLDDLYGSYEAADYLDMDLSLFSWRVHHGVGPKPDRVLARAGDVFTRRTLDGWKANAEIPEVEWPTYMYHERVSGIEWEYVPGLAYSVWRPAATMTAYNETDAKQNAAAWQFVADNWGELTYD